MTRWIALGLLLSAALVSAAQCQALRNVRILEDQPRVRPPDDQAWVQRIVPFCPTDRLPCSRASQLSWLQLEASIDAYSTRRNDPHDSIERIVAGTRQDLAPLVQALQRYFQKHSVSSQAARVSFVQGLVQGVIYSTDDSTGFTEYPKFGLEFLVDEQGDCDDAAVTTGVLLEALGYATYFVNWDADDGAGHLSTAIRNDLGDLKDFQPPAGSPWIVKDSQRLLHVDGTGSTEGCGSTRVYCGPLGHNPWPGKGLCIEGLVATNDPQLSEKLPIVAWNNGGRERPDRTLVDRRNASDREIREEQRYTRSHQQERLRQRLQALGLDSVVLRRIYPWSRSLYYTVVGLLLTVILLFTASAWRKRQRLKARAAEQRRRKRENEL